MPIVLRNFSNQNSVSGIWKIAEDELSLSELCDLSDYDKNLLKNISNPSRRIEILATRALFKQLGLNINIEYEDRKPIANKGYISISHSDSLVAIVYHESLATSVDIEEVNNRILRISKRAFSLEELDFAADDLKILTLMWNCKECVYKIVNEKGLAFKTQIKVNPFRINENISCEFFSDKINRSFEFSYLEILNHTLVWGIDLTNKQ
jgi:hypothetical protein